MKIKNVSGSTLTFKVGKRTYVVANAATVAVDETNDSLIDIEIVGVPAVASFVGTPPRNGYVSVDLNTVADTNTLTIAGVVFEMDSNSTVTSGNTPVDIATGSPSQTTIAGRLKTAINANATLSALGLVATDVITISSTNAKLQLEATGSTLIGDITISKSGSPITLATAVAASDAVGYRTSTVVTTASASTLLVSTGLNLVTSYVISIVTSAGARKLYDGAITVGGGYLFLDATGSTDIASGDVVTIVANGK